MHFSAVLHPCVSKSLGVINKYENREDIRSRERVPFIKNVLFFYEGQIELDKGEQNAINTVKTDWQPHPPPTAKSHEGFVYSLPMTAYLLSI